MEEVVDPKKLRAWRCPRKGKMERGTGLNYTQAQSEMLQPLSTSTVSTLNTQRDGEQKTAWRSRIRKKMKCDEIGGRGSLARKGGASRATYFMREPLQLNSNSAALIDNHKSTGQYQCVRFLKTFHMTAL